MSSTLPAALVADLVAAGYFPQTAAISMERTLRGGRVLAHLVRPETTFDGAEVRRHLTVLALTRSHLLVTHLDDDPADSLNPSQVVATTERVRLERIAGAGLSQVFDTDGQEVRGTEAEVTLGISWGAAGRIDLERAACEDPECQVDHGFTGTIAPADIALRVSALADGERAVAEAIAFHGALLDAIDEAERGRR